MPTGEFVRRVLIVAAVAVAIVLFCLLRDVLFSAFFAVIIAVGLTIPERWFEHWGLTRPWAVALSIILVTAVVIRLAVLIFPTIAVQLADLLNSATDFLDTLADEYQEARGAALFASVFPDFASSPGFARLQEAVQAARPEESVQSWLMGGLALSVLQGLGVVAGMIFNFGLLWLIGIWFAVDPSLHVEASLYLIPRAPQARIREVWSILGETLITWLKAQFISIGITVALVIVLLGVVVDMPNALVVAVFAGIATFIPNIGAFFAPHPDRHLWIVFADSGDAADLDCRLSCHPACREQLHHATRRESATRDSRWRPDGLPTHRHSAIRSAWAAPGCPAAGCLHRSGAGALLL